MSPKSKKAIFDFPSWTSALVAALLAFVATWGALRVTVAGLQSDVADLKALVQTVTVLDAKSKIQEIQLGRMQLEMDAQRDRLGSMAERISGLESRRK